MQKPGMSGHKPGTIPKPSTKAAGESKGMSGVASESAAFGKPRKAGSNRAKHPKR